MNKNLFCLFSALLLVTLDLEAMAGERKGNVIDQ